ncbi:LAMI_0H09912g1_1 [Lachancea mirantina]|uniref:LAMI_0H09912g1_1 n=1 Tax=Lachancea mirantina TaxID=1230905 RepID=A0A1G4KGL3_9SACH|nr:LAMI_0H09912g1_1 [Lachancea mirantina]
MGVRPTSNVYSSPSREMYQKTGASSTLVGSLLKSWKPNSSKQHQQRSESQDGNIEAIRKSQTALRRTSSHGSGVSHMHLSPLRNLDSGNGGTREKHHRSGHKKDKYFTDLDEDWSAVIEDHNMPIPMISNGGSELKPPVLVTARKDSSESQSSSTMYPPLPQLNKSVSSDLKSQYEQENVRDVQELNSFIQRISKFEAIVNPKNSSQIDLHELRKLSWNGVPMIHRPHVWKLLIGYLPANVRRREALLSRKRQEYREGVKLVFSEKHTRDIPTWHQIEIDIPRTNPHIPLYQFQSVQQSLQRILYLWAIRHPASGYVQGINDLVTPFFQTFLTEYLHPSQKDDVYKVDPMDYLTAGQLEDIEADTFWCLAKLLEQITDNYIHGQPGIMKQVKNLSQLVKRIDTDLYDHFARENVEFIQFAFRWMNCLLMREFRMDMVIRMWDTYLSETSSETSANRNFMNMNSISASSVLASPSSPLGKETSNSRIRNDGGTEQVSRQASLSEFHVFVCAAFLVKWSDKLVHMDFQEIITFLQNPPTQNWKESDIELLLSEAYIWQSLYKDATSHWR